MDNMQQIEEIQRYRLHLCKILRNEINLDEAARIWIEKYARLWRNKHPFENAAAWFLLKQ